jgi:HEPN domain-containing protein
MQFTADQYYRVSLERMNQARRLYQEGTAYSLTMYCGGLAVESLLRAFRWTKDTTFEGRHDLSDLLKASRLLRIDDEYMRRKGASEEAIHRSGVRLRGAMNEVIILWHNNLRFACEASLKAFLNKLGRLQGVRGDPLKKNALDLLDAAQTVMDRGVTLWTSKTKL